MHALVKSKNYTMCNLIEAVELLRHNRRYERLKTLRGSPAMAAGVDSRLCEI